MGAICLNDAVWNKYYAGGNLNDAIRKAFRNEIKDRIKEEPGFAELTPLQMVMHDAEIEQDSELDEMINGKNGNQIINSAYTSGGPETNKWLFPAWVETTLRENIYETDLLPKIVTNRISVDGNVVQSPTLDLMSSENKRAIKKARIAELGDIPTGRITIGERAITLQKRGRALSFSYESARRMKVKLFSIQMAAVADDLAHQEVEYAVDVAINGDGNTGSAATLIGQTANANEITAGDIIDGMIEYYFRAHFNANTIIIPKQYLKTVSSMVYDSQLRPGASVNLSFDIPQINFKNLTVVGLPEVQIKGKDVMLFLNRERTLIRYEENGSYIQEMDRFIRNQEQLMTLTENSGYAISVAGSNMYMEILG